MRVYVVAMVGLFVVLTASLSHPGSARTALERTPQSSRGNLVAPENWVSLPAGSSPPWVAATQKVLDRYRVPPGPEGVARVKYTAMGRDPALLTAALDLLRVTDTAQLESPAARQAFWYNTYNLVMMDVVLHNWGGDPRWSVSHQDFRVFKEARFRWMEMDLSLDEIEHGILRGHPEEKIKDVNRQELLRRLSRNTWGGGRPDPHLHMVLNCASVGCPSLTSQALDPLRLSSQLQSLAIQYLADPRRGAGPQGISSLFSWFAADFLPDGKDNFIRRYTPAPASVDLTHYLPYDWSLNVATEGG